MYTDNQNNPFPISAVLTQWYNTHKRDLPWRETTDPYKIWLSEIILQQTKVDQGTSYYIRFVEKYPTIQDLAHAPEDEVMKMWQGLGYYSRARNLHATAKKVVLEYNGVFPSDYKTILSLKGIGEYTAAAIASFAFGQPVAAVDGNVFRVLSRLFAIKEPIDTCTGKKHFTIFANEILNFKDPGVHNQSIMEFGALQCVPKSPNCDACPLSYLCLAYELKNVADFPTKKGKTIVKNRYFSYLDVRCGSEMFIHKRTDNDIWKNLYELPLIETQQELTIEEIIKTEAFEKMFSSCQVQFLQKNIQFKHVLSHRIIHAAFYRVSIQNADSFNEKYIRINESEIGDFPVSRLVHKYLEGHS